MAVSACGPMRILRDAAHSILITLNLCLTRQHQHIYFQALIKYSKYIGSTYKITPSTTILMSEVKVKSSTKGLEQSLLITDHMTPRTKLDSGVVSEAML